MMNNTATSPTLIPFAGKNVPHIVIEVNQKCNISCKACYKDKSSYTKPFEQILSEIDLALSKRNLTLVTLAGGEPLLHPQLEDVISYVHSKGVMVQILSNGFALTDSLLAKYKKAGLKEVFLHIDSGQKRTDIKEAKSEKELNSLRAEIAQRITNHGLICSLTITIYKQNLHQLPDIIEFAQNCPNITRVLFTCYTDFSKIHEHFKTGKILGLSCTFRADADSSNEMKDAAVDIKEVQQIFLDHFGMRPFGYISSDLDSSDPRWLMYHSFSIHTADGKFHYLSLDPKFGKLVRYKLDQTIKKGQKISFGKIMNTKRCIELIVAYALTSLTPAIIFQSGMFLFKLLRPGSTIHYADFTVQQPPKITADGKLSYCNECPDATIRNGVMVPVCMADMLAPAKEEQ